MLVLVLFVGLGFGASTTTQAASWRVFEAVGAVGECGCFGVGRAVVRVREEVERGGDCQLGEDRSGWDGRGGDRVRGRHWWMYKSG